LRQHKKIAMPQAVYKPLPWLIYLFKLIKYVK